MIQAGGNAGWPCYEGNHLQVGYAPAAVCQALYNAGSATGALIEWDHGPGDTASLGGTFYSGTQFPAEYQGAYFYADYTRGWIKRIRVNGSDQLVDGPTDFATGLVGPVQVEAGPDGAIYYVTIGSGELRRIRYFTDYAPIECPTGQYRAEYFSNKTLNDVPAVQRCEGPSPESLSGPPGRAFTSACDPRHTPPPSGPRAILAPSRSGTVGPGWARWRTISTRGSRSSKRRLPRCAPMRSVATGRWLRRWSSRRPLPISCGSSRPLRPNCGLSWRLLRRMPPGSAALITLSWFSVRAT